jgi:hypothetical protein
MSDPTREELEKWGEYAEQRSGPPRTDTELKAWSFARYALRLLGEKDALEKAVKAWQEKELDAPSEAEGRARREYQEAAVRLAEDADLLYSTAAIKRAFALGDRGEVALIQNQLLEKLIAFRTAKSTLSSLPKQEGEPR